MNTLRILVVGINYAPEQISTGKYTAELCEWLGSRGHNVRVVAAPPYYPEWKTWRSHGGLGFCIETIQGVDIYRCPIYVPPKPTGLSRALHLATFGISSLVGLAQSLRWRPHIVINVAPTLASAPGSLLLGIVSGAKSWLHIQDFELDAGLGLGIVKAGWIRRFALLAERVLIGRFDRVSTISENMLSLVRGKGVANAKALLLRNWVDINSIVPLSKPSPYRAELGIPDDAVVALYSGNMGLKQGLELLGAAARELSVEPRLHFVFGGVGPALSDLQRQCEGLPRVHFLGLQPISRLNEWLGLADIHLLPQRANVADLVMPSKLTGMLASGRSVLTTALAGSSLAEAVRDCGRVTTPGSVFEFVQALAALVADDEERQKLGIAARRLAEKTLSKDSILLEWERELYKLSFPNAVPQTIA